eukprot:TRINITY_DN884_c2_g1_i3.p1 TRINITY_DN884_c2_g1~~TRINITY_DN884_c2_g1_i3.p1  ORF type:complete len:153 (+),score=24.62 TRINITY_DN884_c2_g1_i3:59-517(+)
MPKAKQNESINTYKRINYLIQASHLALKIGCNNLSKHYVQTFRKITQRKVLQLSNEVKRSYCKKCSIPLVPGNTATIRIANKREKHVILNCVECGFIKRYNVKRIPSRQSSRVENELTPFIVNKYLLKNDQQKKNNNNISEQNDGDNNNNNE